jgi:hypothetical protein
VIVHANFDLRWSSLASLIRLGRVQVICACYIQGACAMFVLPSFVIEVFNGCSCRSVCICHYRSPLGARSWSCRQCRRRYVPMHLILGGKRMDAPLQAAQQLRGHGSRSNAALSILRLTKSTSVVTVYFRPPAHMAVGCPLHVPVHSLHSARVYSPHSAHANRSHTHIYLLSGDTQQHTAANFQTQAYSRWAN